MNAKEQLEALEQQVKTLLFEQAQLEAKVLTLDEVVGFFMNQGHKPSPAELGQMWTRSAEIIRKKHPDFKLMMQETKPKLYIPTNGAAHRVP